MNAKIYNGNVQPNPKEFKIWVNDEGLIKTWNGTKWVENTASSGGSGSGENKVIYYEVADTFKSMPDGVFSELGAMFVSYKLIINNKYAFLTGVLLNMLIQDGTIDKLLSKTTMVAFMPIDTTPLDMGTGLKFNSVEEWATAIGQDPSYLIKRRVTAEEFYSLETNIDINTFNIVDEDNNINEQLTPNQPYQFEEGMTWEQWLVSDYNTFFDHESITIKPDNVALFEGEFVALSIRLNGAKIKWTDVIISTNYTFKLID